jgi:methionyl-tRNA formyltransferase
MNIDKKSVVFMGSPDFALPSLKLLHQDSTIEIVQIYTQPPKPAGRGQKETPTPVHQYAKEHNLEVRTPKSLRKEEELEFFKTLRCDIVIVVAYGLIIPESYLSIPGQGFMNLHPSDLPKYRGAAPMHAVILNGDEDSAICVMQLDAGMDSGDILMRKEFKASQMNYKQMYDYCSHEGGKMILQVVKNYYEYKRDVQDHSKASFAPKVNKSMAEIKGEDYLKEAINKIRAFADAPGNYILYEGANFKISDIEFSQCEHSEKLGLCISKNDLKFYVMDGYLLIGKIQKPGKSFISSKEFINSLNF